MPAYIRDVSGVFHHFIYFAVLECQMLDTCSPYLRYDGNMIYKIEIYSSLWRWGSLNCSVQVSGKKQYEGNIYAAFGPVFFPLWEGKIFYLGIAENESRYIAHKRYKYSIFKPSFCASSQYSSIANLAFKGACYIGLNNL